ncbi:MAG: rubrerythrin family protein [Clostridium baratii]|uniref:Rubrerythrin-1 n=1 Tax=Clostridium baratii str. Sullivan TaxID=1415775 RepID=A0A0A7FTT4_9CLOT|nr:rubrerythrin family protein [Clostridium baratii]AIY82983.1 rubrerythrin-1 [Clostridium baratii str. Sullivan]MBS6007757.1 rubrerythrin family protein [Clostridium baratii]MDU1054550.1 rubrerythrin family protein [Clostridium baratii]MDU4911341.1 rubrerythrin family protein [Clostridium baratii]CUP71610.1 rubrerythrin [Clostridium baratii]
MKSLKGSKTADNLAKAFAGESQARNRYTFYSRVAAKEGHKQIEAVFLETADNERAHAKVFYDLLVEGLGHTDITVNADYPIGFGTTLDNLKYAAEGERDEWGTAYPEFAKIAKEEGYPEVYNAFSQILTVEKHHEQRYLDLYANLKDNLLYVSETPQYWKCRNCGYIFEGTEAPKKCPACYHPQGFFEIAYDTKAYGPSKEHAK